MAEYKPLTPGFRQDINNGFDKQIAELKTCKPNALVSLQIETLSVYKRLINGLPDGYPIPLADRTCPYTDKWYACPIEDAKPESIQTLKEYAKWMVGGEKT